MISRTPGPASPTRLSPAELDMVFSAARRRGPTQAEKALKKKERKAARRARRLNR